MTLPEKSDLKSQVNDLFEHFKANDISHAESLASKLTLSYPDHPFAWKVLGTIYLGSGREPEAIEAYKRAVLLAPQDAESHNNFGISLKRMGRLREARRSYVRSIELNPDYAQAHNNLGSIQKELGEVTEAELSCRRAIMLRPDYPEAHSNLGIVLHKLGRLDEAEQSCRYAIELAPCLAEANNNLGMVLLDLGRVVDAEEYFQKALLHKPNYPEAALNFASASQQLGRFSAAKSYLIEALKMRPSYAEAHRHLVSLKTFITEDKQFNQMEQIYLSSNTTDQEKCHINFALAKANEDLGNYEISFKHYQEGNALRKKESEYDINHDLSIVTKIKSDYLTIKTSGIDFHNLPRSVVPIFIVGMPRSGTTLVEQIISSHPKVEGAGELDYINQLSSKLHFDTNSAISESILKFRDVYLHRLKSISKRRPYVTDKMPQNFRFLGLISTALPECKIIHIRRESAAVCWGNFKQYFVSSNMDFSYSLDDIIRYIQSYRELMLFWETSIGNNLIHVDYEILVQNQEVQTRRIIDYLGLDWNDACLSPQKNSRRVATASNVQVKKSVYQNSSDQWKKYEKYLKPFLRQLTDN